MSWITVLSRLLGEPLPAGDRIISDWQMVEYALNVSYPDAYKEFIDSWGQGKYADFIHFFQPHSKHKALTLPQAVQGFVYAYASSKSGNPSRYSLPILPQMGGFLPFAITDNGDYFGWLITEKSPQNWTVSVLNHEEATATDLGLSFTEFMASLANQSIRKDILPEDFFELPQVYERY